MANIKMGLWYSVSNQNPHRLASLEYIAAKIEDNDGNNERWILLTNNEFKRLHKISIENAFDSFKCGRIYKMNFQKKNYCIIKMGENNQAYIFSEKSLLKFTERANKNQEDIPKQSFLADLLD